MSAITWYCSVYIRKDQRIKTNDVIAERRRHVQKVCASNKAFIRAKKARDSAEMFRYLYVDDKHHFLYCEVPKVGMSTADQSSNMLNVVPESIL